MKVIRDSIHGDIFLGNTELKIVDTPEFQRLRRLKQLGMTYFVYPGANHTRFEHSLGSFYLAEKLSEKIGLHHLDKTKIKFAALLHDTGHGPLSHTSEELLQRYLGVSHEKITEHIIENSKITSILEEVDIKPNDISDILAGKSGFMSKMISSEFDVDRMDFLVRDAHHTGVAYGVIDLDRLLNTIKIFDNDLVVEKGGLKAVEALLVARFLMMPTVYLHHTSRIADKMFLNAIERAIQNESLNYNLLFKMDDYSIQNLFRNSKGYVHDIGERFDRRDLFKNVFSRPWAELNEDMRKNVSHLRQNVMKWKKIEEEISIDLNIDEGYILLDLPPVSQYKEIKGQVILNNILQNIGDASPLIRILKKAQEEILDIGVYTLKEHFAKFNRVNIEQYLE
tara:strand:+ start:2998 stop:4182 length:1185 start_codon:yes stop_codon:yes gene_type:complete